MAERFRAEDIDRLLELAQSSQLRDAGGLGHGEPDTGHHSPLWRANHEFWIDCLRDETGNAWTDQQYDDAARLLNVAEHQQVVFREFAGALHGMAAERPELRAQLVWSNTSGSGSSNPGHRQVSSDQLIFREAGDVERYAVNGFDPGTPWMIDDQHTPPWAAARDMIAKGAHADGGSSRRDDLALANSLRGRESGEAVFNTVRTNLFVLTGLESLKPYHDWDDFQTRNDLPPGLTGNLGLHVQQPTLRSVRV